ncbi:MAG: Acyl-coenzyme A dehydrogenase [Legionellaceae bacterium]
MLWLLLIVSVVLVLAYRGSSLTVWIPSLGSLFFLMTILGQFSFISLISLWTFYLALTLFLTQDKIRRQYFSKHVLTFFKRHLPPLSMTEQEVLDSGDICWEADLFQGNPDWKKWRDLPQPKLTQEEKVFIDKQVNILCSMLDDWTINYYEHDLPQTVWNYLKQECFFGMTIPKVYNGLGFSAFAHSTIIAKIASRSVSAAVNTMVPNSLGPGELLFHYGTQEQKNYYLPRLARGEEIPCFALTSPEAGSDASAIPDTGIICKGMHEGKEVIGISLNWDKRYITLAPIATILGLAFKLYDPNGLLGDKKNLGITLCLIPTSHPGIEIGKRHNPMSMGFMNGPTRGVNVFIPLDWIIGGPERVGQGWRMLMECLSIGRAISLPALSTGCSTITYRMTGAYAHLRKQFNMPIGQFEGVEEALARMGGYTYLLEAMRISTAGAIDQGIKPSVISAIAKYHMTEMVRQLINDAMDIHAGRGIQLGPRNYLAQQYLALPIFITVEGANILTRNLIIFGQGAIRCHPFLRLEMAAAGLDDKETRLQRFDELLMLHINYAFKNGVRTLIHGLTNGYFIKKTIVTKRARYYQQLTRMSSALAFTVDITLLIVKGNLKRKEHLSARLGDILSRLYLASTVLRYFGYQQESKEDLPYVDWIIQSQLFHIQRAFNEIFANFPNKTVAVALRYWIFPWGQVFQPPQDKLGHEIAQSMMEKTGIRDRISQYCYLNTLKNDVIGQVEYVFALSKDAEPLELKFQQAISTHKLKKAASFKDQLEEAVRNAILTEAEAQLLLKYKIARYELMQVDEFEFNEFKRSAKG